MNKKAWDLVTLMKIVFVIAIFVFFFIVIVSGMFSGVLSSITGFVRSQ